MSPTSPDQGIGIGPPQPPDTQRRGLTRRGFLKGAGALAGGLAFAAIGVKPTESQSRQKPTPEIDTIALVLNNQSFIEGVNHTDDEFNKTLDALHQIRDSDHTIATDSSDRVVILPNNIPLNPDEKVIAQITRDNDHLSSKLLAATVTESILAQWCQFAPYKLRQAINANPTLLERYMNIGIAGVLDTVYSEAKTASMYDGSRPSDKIPDQFSKMMNMRRILDQYLSVPILRMFQNYILPPEDIRVVQKALNELVTEPEKLPDIIQSRIPFMSLIGSYGGHYALWKMLGKPNQLPDNLDEIELEPDKVQLIIPDPEEFAEFMQLLPIEADSRGNIELHRAKIDRLPTLAHALLYNPEEKVDNKYIEIPYAKIPVGSNNYQAVSSIVQMHPSNDVYDSNKSSRYLYLLSPTTDRIVPSDKNYSWYWHGTDTPTPEYTPTALSTPTTPPEPSSTFTETRTPQATATRTSTPTLEPSPSPTSTPIPPTETSVPPTATPEATATSTHTRTPKPPPTITNSDVNTPSSGFWNKVKKAAPWVVGIGAGLGLGGAAWWREQTKPPKPIDIYKETDLNQ